MLVAVLVVVIILLIALILGWYTWRLFGSFRLEDLTEEQIETDSLAQLTDAHEMLQTGVDKLTRELDLMKAGARRRG